MVQNVRFSQLSYAYENELAYLCLSRQQQFYKCEQKKMATGILLMELDIWKTWCI